MQGTATFEEWPVKLMDLVLKMKHQFPPKHYYRPATELPSASHFCRLDAIVGWSLAVNPCPNAFL